VRCGTPPSGGLRRSRVIMQLQIESSRLPMVRTHRPPPTARGTSRSSHLTPCTHIRSPHCTTIVRTSRHAPTTTLTTMAAGVGTARHSASPRGGQTARVAVGPPTSERGVVRPLGGGLTTSLCIRQVVPGYRVTWRRTQYYLSIVAKSFIFSDH
jgi:hypothetical protein